jgi:signal peptide peptidase SppA
MKRLFLIAVGIALTVAAVEWAIAEAPARPDILEVVELSNEIGEGTAKAFGLQVEKINETPKIKAVLLVVNSPGGGASASAALYQELSKLKVPVVAYCEYVCASGAIYAMMAPSVKHIAVSDEAIGGSVGVVAMLTSFNRLLKWAMIDPETFKSGPLKDSGNPTRALNDTDRTYIQSIVDQLAVKFYGVVTKARPKANMDEIKTARVFIGSEIVRVGLADAVMTREQAELKAKALSGSKMIFTREQLKKMSSAANETTMYGGGTQIEPKTWYERPLQHLDTAMELLQEIRSGEAVRFEYKLNYRF